MVAWCPYFSCADAYGVQVVLQMLCFVQFVFVQFVFVQFVFVQFVFVQFVFMQFVGAGWRICATRRPTSCCVAT